MIAQGRHAGKIAVVTAAGQGIGRAVADRLAAEGATVHASDINPALLEGAAHLNVASLDGTDYDAVARYFQGIGRVDILVHAVGYVHQGTLEECTPEDWNRSEKITLQSAFNVMQGALPNMKDHGGSIVTIASVVSSIKGLPKRAAYGSMKAGVIGLMKSVACDYLANGIRCNAVCPGTIDSPSLRERIAELAVEFGDEDKAWKFFLNRQPTGRMGTVEEVAGLCAYLTSDEAEFITGQTINIDGGITI